MTTPDHIGADPALGVGAGQTRRSTPVDLAREVLDAAKKQGIGAYPTRYTEPVITCASAAPTLAHAVLSLTAEVDACREQVARIKALADDLDAEANTFMDDADPGRAKTSYAHSARIRTALNSVD